MITFHNSDRIRRQILKDDKLSAVHKHLHLLGASVINALFKSAYPDTWQEIIKEWDSNADYKMPQGEFSRMIVFNNSHAEANSHSIAEETKTKSFRR